MQAAQAEGTHPGPFGWMQGGACEGLGTGLYGASWAPAINALQRPEHGLCYNPGGPGQLRTAAARPDGTLEFPGASAHQPLLHAQDERDGIETWQHREQMRQEGPQCPQLSWPPHPSWPSAALEGNH